MYVNIVISGDRNIIKKGGERISKCKDLTVEILPMWIATAKVIPVIIVAAAIISK